jgi:hypothetical protein
VTSTIFGCGRLCLANPVNADIVFIQEANHFRQCEKSSFYFVLLRIKGIVVGTAEISFHQVCVLKDGPRQIAVFKHNARKVTVGKIGFLQMCISELGAFDFNAIERSVVQDAVLKAKREPKVAALVKAKPQHLAILKYDILENSFDDACQAQIAPGETAVDKFPFGQIGIAEITIREQTPFVFSFWERAICKIISLVGFIMYKYFLHDAAI